MTRLEHGGMAANLVLLVSTVVLFLLFAEAFVRVSGLEKPVASNAIDYDLVRERVLGFSVVHQVSASPDLGWEQVPNAKGFSSSSLGGTTPIEINALGFRDVQFSQKKPAGVYRIVILGDSMTFGLSVPAEASFPKVLEGMLNTNLSPQSGLIYQVINAGVNGYNTYQEIALLKLRGLALEPDLVILGFVENDLDNPSLAVLTQEATISPAAMPNPGGTPIVAAAETGPQQPAAPASVIQRIKNLVREHSFLYRFVVRRVHSLEIILGRRDKYDLSTRRYLTAYDRRMLDQNAVEWQWLNKQLADLRDTAAANKLAAPLVVYLPWEHMLESSYKPEPQVALKVAVEKLGMAYFDPLPALLGKRHESLYVDALHFNLRGHQLAAQALYDELVKKSLVPPAK